MKSIFTLFILIGSSLLFGQTTTEINVERLAIDYLTHHKEDWQLSAADLQEIHLSDQVFTQHNGVTSLYFTQQHNGISIEHAIFNINILPDGKVLSASSRFHSNIANIATHFSKKTQPSKALKIVLKSIGLSTKIDLIGVEEQPYFHRYNKSAIVQSDITCQLLYSKIGATLIPVWKIVIHPKQDDLWAIKVHANTGEILDKKRMTLHCGITPLSSVTAATCPILQKAKHTNRADTDGSSYRVFPWQTESPLYGNRMLLTEPARLTASPFGWHDVDGISGPEYTITRGNNVHAYSDLSNNNQSAGDEPNGGASLTFDFPFNTNGEPAENRDAAVINLFYMVNFMHDFSFQYGFDEDAGNFQKENYTGPNFKENDPVRAQAQDGKTHNNASFSTPADGASPTLEMHIFANQGAEFLDISSPSNIVGKKATGVATFGVPITTSPIVGEVVLINDGDPSNPSFGCTQTSQNLTGKIALVDRGGSCFHANKAIYAQAKGAVGLIVANFENDIIGMSSPEVLGNQVTIPLVLISSSDALLIKAQINTGNTVQVSLVKNNLPNPDSLDSDFSNITIAHEYSHGISTRLTGGGANSACLFNDEQMGEGWSDFFALAISSNATQAGSEARGMGNYLLRKGISGKGGRRFPYSTDLNINPLTYYDILNTNTPHAVGEVWASCLWDLYWLMVAEYGFDDDIFNGTGGNNKAIQLVIDGLKLQPCSPGFIDARDAILAADIANNNGANACLIWTAFSRRGIGVSASQGDVDNRNDGIESYDQPQSCSKGLTLKKHVSPVINDGETITVDLIISNFSGTTLTGVSVTDIIPSNTNFVMGSSTHTATTSGNEIIFGLGAVPNQTSMTITYQLSTALGNPSTSLWRDDFETDDTKWIKETVSGENFWNWDLSSSLGYAHSGTHSFFITGEDGASDQRLSILNPIQVSGAKPILRFFQRIDTKPGQDGGILEFSTNGGTHWFDADDYFFRKGYNRPMSFWTFGQSDQNGFSGKTAGYIETMVDLSSFLGEDLDMRFRFASHFEKFDVKSLVWSIDDVEIMDMVNYNSLACVTADQGNQVCTEAKEQGTIVYSDVFVENKKLPNAVLNFRIHPNPTADILNISFVHPSKEMLGVTILDLNGQTLLHKAKIDPNVTLVMPITDLPTGVYIVQIHSKSGIGIQKLVVH